MAKTDLPATRRLLDSDWRELVNLDKLGRWMDLQGLESGAIEDPVRLTGGTQNILLKFSRGGRQFVLRRPPQTPYFDGSKTILREARLLRSLSDTAVPHPRLIADCADQDVLGAAFYLMEPIAGFCVTQGLPPLHVGSPAVRHQMGLAAIDGLAALHALDFREVGLGDLGKPEGYLEKQVPRWLGQLESYSAYGNWTGRTDLKGMDVIAAWLTSHIPKSHKPGIVHGDFHLANVLYSFDSPDLTGIVDWELATIGDTMVDLGWLLATWADPDGAHPGCISIVPWDGFPTEAELIARYGEATGRDIESVNWFVVLACFKLGIIQEGTCARASAGQADPDVGALLHGTAIKLFDRALTRI